MQVTGHLEAPSVGELLEGVRNGDADAWATLVRRFGRLLETTARGYRLARPDVADVTQTVWLRLIEKGGSIRDPQCLTRWLVVTTHRECLALLRQRTRTVPTGDEEALQARMGEEPDGAARVVAAEQTAALRRALGGLAPRCRRLIEHLFAESRPGYEETSMALGMPIGSIGPTRARCLACLERLMSTSAAGTGAGAELPGPRVA